MEMDGRTSILLGTTPTAETFQFININQFTVSNPTGNRSPGKRRENGENVIIFRSIDSRARDMGWP